MFLLGKKLFSCMPLETSSRPKRWVCFKYIKDAAWGTRDFEDLATGLLLSLGPTCGTLFRPKLDNRVTISYSSRINWKHFCSSSPEPFCGSISNEGLYKYSIILLLLKHNVEYCSRSLQSIYCDSAKHWEVYTLVRSSKPIPNLKGTNKPTSIIIDRFVFSDASDSRRVWECVRHGAGRLL